MSEQKTAKQHVVPKFYLRRFTNEAGNLEVFDNEAGRFSRPRNPSAVGYDFYFYARTTGQEDETSQEIETFLNGFENYISLRYVPICEKILSGASLDDEDLRVISLHASILWLRGYGLRSQVNLISESLTKRGLQMAASHRNATGWVKDVISASRGRELTDEEASAAVELMRSGEYRIVPDNTGHLSMLEDYRGYANLFRAKKLRIYVADGAARFVTSDIPVMELAPPYAREPSVFGLSFVEMLHSLPLSSRILVEFHDPEALRGKPVTRRRISDDMVAAANARQLAGARRWCVGESKGDFHAWREVPDSGLLVAPQIGSFAEDHLEILID